MGDIRVLIVDDHPVVRTGLRSMLQGCEGITVAGEASDSCAAVEQAQSLKPDVILLDVRMPGIGGIQVIRQLMEVSGARVVVLTTYDEEEYLDGAIRAGAHGYLLKTCPLEELNRTIHEVHQGKRMLEPCLIENLMNSYEQLAKRVGERELGISETERHVLKLIAEGATNREIAEKLYWSEVTVKRKTIDIYKKLNVSDRASAVAEAMRKGLV